MNATGALVTLSPRDFDAILFDLDGVLTKTAQVHAAAWKRLFDQFLEQRSAGTGEPFVPFDVDEDYRHYVDGRRRQDGVTAFLQSRKIDFPLGAPDDASDVRSVHGLGNLKDQYFLEELDGHGVERYETSIDLVRALRAEDIRTAVVSSSNNCAAVLAAAGISDLFDVRVDGLDLTRLALKAKPAPDAFLEAVRQLALEPSQAVVVEDAIAGVEAGRAGGLGLVIGVDRGGRSLPLRRAGADTSSRIWHKSRSPQSSAAWSLVYEGYDPAGRGHARSPVYTRERLLRDPRGRTGRGSDGVHYPGTYLAGGYNRLRTDIGGRTVENEDLVNLPNWLALSFASPTASGSMCAACGSSPTGRSSI